MEKNLKHEHKVQILWNERKIRRTEIYNIPLNTLYRLFIDPIQYKNIFSNYITQLECISGINRLNNPSSIFKMMWKGVVKSYFKIVEPIEEEYYKNIKFYFPARRFLVEHKFYWLSVEQQTMVVFESTFEDNYMQYFLSNWLDEEKDDAYTKARRFLNISYLKSEEVFIVGLNIEVVFKGIVEWKLQNKIQYERTREIEAFGIENNPEFIIIKNNTGDRYLCKDFIHENTNFHVVMCIRIVHQNYTFVKFKFLINDNLSDKEIIYLLSIRQRLIKLITDFSKQKKKFNLLYMD
jgi:hypothetical protein